MKRMVKATVVLLVSSLASVVTMPALALEGNAQAGKGKTAACAGCHASDGNSTAAVNPKLAGQSAAYLAKQLADFKAGNRQNGIMQGMAANLSEQDMADIAAYYAGQTVKVGKADPAKLALGERLYRGGNLKSGVAACSGCHGPAGAGLPGAGFPALSGQHAAYTVAQLKAFRAAGRGDHDGVKRTNDADPDTVASQGMMRTVTAKMTDDEIVAVASFIAGLGK